MTAVRHGWQRPLGFAACRSALPLSQSVATERTKGRKNAGGDLSGKACINVRIMLLDARPSDDGSRLALLILVDEIVERFSVDRLIVFERCRVILDAEAERTECCQCRWLIGFDCYVILFHSFNP